MFGRNDQRHTHATLNATPTHPTTRATISPDPAAATARTTTLRSASFNPPRRRWPGVLAACVLGAGIGALAISSFYDDRSVGERLDATVASAQQGVEQRVTEMRNGAESVARDGAAAGAQVGERAASALGDAGITAAVKTALAADPKLSALQIDVDTHDGVVSLQGPAPDEQSRERAEVLAAAPAGVQRVDNRLVVTPPAQTALR